MAEQAIMTSRDPFADDAVSIHSFDTILPSYSEATLPRYTPPANRVQFTASSTSPRPISRLPPVPKQPKILSISQSNLPRRFTGPQSNYWAPKADAGTGSGKPRKRSADLNICFTSRAPSGVLAHGDTSETPVITRRRSPPRIQTRGLSFDDQIRMRELDELTRAISLRDDARRAYPRALPQVTGSLRRESRLLGDEWDSLAAEAQKEEFVVRITELETQFEDRQQLPHSMTTALFDDIRSVQAMLTARRSDVSEILAGQVAKLRQLKQDGVKVSHSQKDQIRLDMMAMKSEISFLEQKTEELRKLADKVKADDVRRTALEDDSKNWDLWMGATGR
jgi:hypothetical protein